MIEESLSAVVEKFEMTAKGFYKNLLISAVSLFLLSPFALSKNAGEKVTLAFNLIDVNGNLIYFKKYFEEIMKDKSCAVVNFFSRNCPECEREIPFIKKVYKNYADKGVEVFMIVSGEDADYAQKIKTQYQIPFHVLSDKLLISVQEWKVGRVFPQTFIVGKDRKVLGRFFGNLGDEKLKNYREKFFSEIENCASAWEKSGS